MVHKGKSLTYAEFLQLASRQAPDRLTIFWVAVDDSGADNARAQASLLDGVVDDFATLGVAGYGNLRARALLDGLLSELSHDWTTARAEESVRLDSGGVVDTLDRDLGGAEGADKGLCGCQ